MSITSFIKRVCVQTAVYWAAPSSDGYNDVYGTPVEVACRWDGSTKLITDGKGDETVAIAKVLVTQDLEIDGLLYLGALSGLTPAQKSDPATIPEAYKIKKFDKNPLFRKTDKFVRVAWL
jgi:hypothetical protein